MENASNFSPYIAAAIIAGAVSLFGLLLKSIYDAWETRRFYKERRDDMQKALYAEIRAFVALQERNELNNYRDAVVDKIRKDGFIPFFIEDDHDSVHRALIADIHYLPKETIDEITIYYQILRQVREMQKSMKSNEYHKLEPERRALIYRDYIETIATATRDGKAALNYIEIFAEDGKQGVEEYKSALARKHAEEQKLEVKAWLDTENQ